MRRKQVVTLGEPRTGPTESSTMATGSERSSAEPAFVDVSTSILHDMSRMVSSHLLRRLSTAVACVRWEGWVRVQYAEPADLCTRNEPGSARGATGPQVPQHELR